MTELDCFGLSSLSLSLVSLALNWRRLLVTPDVLVSLELKNQQPKERLCKALASWLVQVQCLSWTTPVMAWMMYQYYLSLLFQGCKMKAFALYQKHPEPATAIPEPLDKGFGASLMQSVQCWALEYRSHLPQVGREGEAQSCTAQCQSTNAGSISKPTLISKYKDIVQWKGKWPWTAAVPAILHGNQNQLILGFSTNLTLSTEFSSLLPWFSPACWADLANEMWDLYPDKTPVLFFCPSARNPPESQRFCPGEC